ncbi:uncharacterized protein L3040_002100 [Drepanopeziza brunnea f. sp. 'multigermtubi']|uniref:uncharacterized protein n=1 Tax=Drepanopeziza brunnea f. sp. 'multigermtubi' TaxID=698441 RepID=UPI00239AAA39|nr:hypothetical protein L3040_002100 [Drepanopeziza brunnea f. sp. 'multigermtubi']
MHPYHRQGREGQLGAGSLAKNNGQNDVWDPYILASANVPRARLDAKKLKDIELRLQVATRIVPTAVEWTAKTKEYGLIVSELQDILRVAFGDDQLPSTRPLNGRARLPKILGLAAQGLSRANELEKKSDILRRVGTVARIIAYTLLGVPVVSGESGDSGNASDEQARILPTIIHCAALILWVDQWANVAGGKKWIVQSRSLARFWCRAIARMPHWRGREWALHLMIGELSGIATGLPADVSRVRRSASTSVVSNSHSGGLGEFVSTLESEIYWGDLPVLHRLPGVVEYVIALLDGCVSQNVIFRALGCPDSYLDTIHSTPPAGTSDKMASSSSLITRSVVDNWDPSHVDGVVHTGVQGEEPYSDDPFALGIPRTGDTGSNEITDPYHMEILLGPVSETAGCADATTHDGLQPSISGGIEVITESFNHGFVINEANVMHPSSTISPELLPDLMSNPIAAHALGRNR